MADVLSILSSNYKTVGLTIPTKTPYVAVDPALYPQIEGQTDSEVLFFLALSMGLQDDVPGALARAIGLVEACGQRRGVQYPFQGTIATTDGQRTWVLRYSSEGKSRSLFFTKDVATLRALYPHQEVLQELSTDARLVVSEPIGDLPGAWNEMPEASCGVISAEGDELLPFAPQPPPRSRSRSS